MLEVSIELTLGSGEAGKDLRGAGSRRCPVLWFGCWLCGCMFSGNSSGYALSIWTLWQVSYPLKKITKKQNQWGKDEQSIHGAEIENLSQYWPPQGSISKCFTHSRGAVSIGEWGAPGLAAPGQSFIRGCLSEVSSSEQEQTLGRCPGWPRLWSSSGKLVQVSRATALRLGFLWLMPVP